MDLFSELKERGLIFQTSNEEAVKQYLSRKGGRFYIGFDPSAKSLHIGSLLPIVFMKRLEQTGVKPIVLVGGATGLIGDPSGKSQERNLLDLKTVKENSNLLKKQLSRFFRFGSILSSSMALFVNNYGWVKKISFIDFLRDIGKNFTISEMINKESVQKRLETGISFTEFNYMVLQAFDFLNLYEKYDCFLQIGASDQWGNITAGIELIRKKLGKKALGLTMPLVTKADGTKYGKTESGSIWLDAKLTSPFHFYQFWINVEDGEVIKLLKYYTFLSLSDIKDLEDSVAKAPEKREAQKVLAKEMTEFVHGKNAAETAEKISRLLFSGRVKELDTAELKEVFSGSAVNPVRSRLAEGGATATSGRPASNGAKEMEKFEEMPIVDFLVAAKVVDSKRQAREDVENKAIEINGEKVSDLEYIINKKDMMQGKYILIKRGKRDYHFIKI